MVGWRVDIHRFVPRHLKKSEELRTFRLFSCRLPWFDMSDLQDAGDGAPQGLRGSWAIAFS